MTTCSPFVECAQCDHYLPIVHQLWRRGYPAYLEQQMGGGVHAIRIGLPYNHYALIGEDSFSFYEEGEDDGQEGFEDHFLDADDPPNAEQTAILFDMAAQRIQYVEQARLREAARPKETP